MVILTPMLLFVHTAVFDFGGDHALPLPVPCPPTTVPCPGPRLGLHRALPLATVPCPRLCHAPGDRALPYCALSPATMPCNRRPCIAPDHALCPGDGALPCLASNLRVQITRTIFSYNNYSDASLRNFVLCEKILPEFSDELLSIWRRRR